MIHTIAVIVFAVAFTVLCVDVILRIDNHEQGKIIVLFSLAILIGIGAAII